MKTKNNSTVLNGFGGVNKASGHGDIHSASLIKNFRILNDGTLEKRQGFRFVTDLGGNVRALYGNRINGSFCLFVLIESNVYTIDRWGTLTHLGNVETSEGNACFFFFREMLYLLDGEAVYEYADNAFRKTVGYVPLVAKNWQNDVIGDPHEPRNILNPHARATYIVSDKPSIYLCTGAPIRSVEAVYVNHGTLDPSKYSFNNTFNTVNVQGLQAGDLVEVYFTYENDHNELVRRLCSSTSTALFGGIGSNRLFVCGGNRTGTVFSTKSISNADLQLSRLHYPTSTELYFPEGYEFDAGDGINAVQAVVRQYGHILIFTESDVWMITPDEDGSEFATATGVNGRIGCPVEGGALLSDNDPISIGDHSVYSWETGSQSKCIATSISSPIASELSDDLLRSCGIHYDVTRNELWLYNSSLTYVWIYNTVAKAWYRFDGICADRIFDLDGSVAFIKNSRLYVFDESCYSDTDEYDYCYDISAEYVTNVSALGSGDMKRLSSISVSATLCSDSITVSLSPCEGPTVCSVISDVRNGTSDITTRLPVGRFMSASLTLATSSPTRQKIHGITLITR